MRMRVALTGTAIATLSVLALKSGTEAGIWVQFVLGKLAYSTSDGAALYLLGFFAVAVWRLQLANSTQLSHPGGALALPVFGLALAVGHLTNLWLTVRYLHEMQIPLGNHVYHWTQDGYSFTGLFHSHLGKTAFAVLSSALSWQPSGYDSGGVFVAWAPAWASWLIGLSFVAGCIAAVVALPVVARRLAWPHVLMFGLAAALSLRGMVDGGPLASGMPPLFVALAWVALRARINTRSQLVFWALAIAGTIGFASFWLSASSGLPSLGGFLFPMLLMVWLGVAGAGKPVRPWMMPLRLLLVSLLTVLLVFDAVDNLLPMVTHLPKGCRALTVEAMPKPGDASAGLDCSGKTPFEIYRAMGEDPRKPRHTLLMPAPIAGDYGLSVNLLLLDSASSRFSPTPSKTWTGLMITPLTAPGGWLKLTAQGNRDWPPVLAGGQPDTLTRNNYNVYLWELARLLQKGGLTEFILMPQTLNNQADF